MAFTESCIIDDACIAAIEKCIPLGPLHNPANLMGIRACQKIMPNTPQVAVFDTAFHMTMPPKAYIYAIPYEYYEKDDVRRYGFHGTSHRYVSARAIDMLGNPEHSRVICCHLGNGSSLSACVDGKCMDTSMGLGPLAGFPMGTRSGDVDATILEYLMGRYGYDIKEMLNILNKKSGVLGISGVSSDFRDLDAAAAQGNERAQLALDKFIYEVKKSSAPTPPSWAGWTPSCSPPASARTPSTCAPDLRGSGVHGHQDGRREEQRPRQGGGRVRRRLQGEDLRHPHQRGADDRHGYRRPVWQVISPDSPLRPGLLRKKARLFRPFQDVP